MNNIRRIYQSFNSTRLWQAAIEREFRLLSLVERQLARRYGLDPHTARLLAALAGLGNGGRP